MLIGRNVGTLNLFFCLSLTFRIQFGNFTCVFLKSCLKMNANVSITINIRPLECQYFRLCPVPAGSYVPFYPTARFTKHFVVQWVPLSRLVQSYYEIIFAKGLIEKSVIIVSWTKLTFSCKQIYCFRHMFKAYVLCFWLIRWKKFMH